MDSQTINTNMAFNSPQEEMNARQVITTETLESFPYELVKLVDEHLGVPLHGILTNVLKFSKHNTYARVYDMCVMKNGLLAVSYGCNINIWNVNTGQWLRMLNGHSKNIVSLCALGEGRLASGSYDKTIRIWDVENGECKAVLRCGSSVLALCLLKDGQLASASFGETEDNNDPIPIWELKTEIRIWNINTKEYKTIIVQKGDVKTMCELGDRKIALSSLDDTVRICDIDTGECTSVLRYDSRALALCVLEDGRIAAGYYNNKVKIWNIKTGACDLTLTGHRESVHSLCLSGDGSLVTGSFDRTIKLWDVNSGECIQTLSGNTQCVIDVCLLEDLRIAALSFDNTVRIWR